MKKAFNIIGKAFTGIGVLGFVIAVMAADSDPLEPVLKMTLISFALIGAGIALIHASGEKVMFS